MSPIQIKPEILELLRILKKEKPRYILKIGTAQGGVLFLFSLIADLNAKIISIDLPGGGFGGGYPIWKIPLYKSFARENQKIYLIRRDSHKQGTLREIEKILSGNKLDLLFIDGDHTYNGVKQDFEMYTPLVKANGIIALHDIVIHPPETGCEVYKFWQENKNNFKYSEIVFNSAQNWGGIGIIYK